MTGKLKTRGNVMLATKLDSLLSVGSTVAPVNDALTSFLQIAGAKGGKAKL